MAENLIFQLLDDVENVEMLVGEEVEVGRADQVSAENVEHAYVLAGPHVEKEPAGSIN